MSESETGAAVAIVGMAGRFPGAADVDAFWDALLAGRPGLRTVTDDELRAAGVDGTRAADARYVRVTGPVDDVAGFDAPFFGFTPGEAEATDPQYRLFLECCWEALEAAGYRPDRMPGSTGVFGGCGFSHYLQQNLLTRPDLTNSLRKLQFAAGNDRDALTTMVSYKLGLRGPSLGVQSFCSTSLSAVHLAVQSLLTYESDMALAGGASIDLPQPTGYRYEEGGIVSPDGTVRSFDAAANGTVVANAVGVVALKRLDDALRDGDQVHAVIVASAMNNDGRGKVGYSAPGTAGQSAVIEDAIRLSGVDPADIGYVECHATGTMLGDSVELAAMRQAFAAIEQEQPPTARRPVTVLGSLKPTHGHMDRASGVAGLIRASLSLCHGVLPGTPHFRTPNAALAEANGRFAVLTEGREWPRDGRPRHAGVSSFGLGGTNVHLVLREAPEPAPRPAGSGPYLLAWSARDEQALAALAQRLHTRLSARDDLDLRDVAYTLLQSRTGFAVRAHVVCADRDDVLAALADPTRWSVGTTERRNPPVRVDLPEAEAATQTWKELSAAFPGLHPTGGSTALVRLLSEAGLHLAGLTGPRLRRDELADLPIAEPGAAGGPTLTVAPPDRAPAAWLLCRVGDLWLSGVDWDWSVLSDGHRRRVTLPTYPFKRRRYWIEPGQPAATVASEPDLSRRDDLADWFYQPVWRNRPLFARVDPQRLRELGPWLVQGEGTLADAVTARLREAGAQVATVRPGPAFGGTAADGFTARVDDHDDYQRLIEALGTPPRTVLWGPGPGRPVPADAGVAARVAAFDEAQRHGFHGARALAAALLRRPAAEPLRLLLLSRFAQHVVGDDLRRPEDATLSGLALVLSQEHAGVVCRHIDLDASWDRPLSAQVIDDLLAEACDGAEPQAAHRDGGRWVRDYEPLPVPPVAARTARPGLPDGAVVLITGGLGEVGFALAEHLARTVRARLVLTTASVLPPREQWDAVLRDAGGSERVRRCLRHVLALEQVGAQVLALSADAADLARMTEVVAMAEQRFGRLDAVVHGAGVSHQDHFDTAVAMTDTQAAAHFRPKVHGLLALQEALGDRAPHRLALSSLAAVLGGLGFAAYAAANAAMDAYALEARQAGAGRWLSVDWEAWRTRAEAHLAPGTTIAAYAMSVAEGVEVFDRAWSLIPGLGHVVTSSGPLAARQAQWTVAASSAKPAAEVVARPRHPRPELTTPFVPPATQLQRRLAQIWSNVLGIERIGLDDVFFELGGHSLLATQLSGQVQQELGIAVSVMSVLHHPTLRQYAAELAAAAGGRPTT
ncbi:SDR family NAD(P)-dependent oxidoreductase [Micromonospora sp. KC207]|uniref:SDR family NAD(P)-dependent oxidoreductase n=1 Tax=Micromonospora sp. KC207 TaxID=2530377 RepID=UPI00104AE744|nr:SDR family NAD(P)-dependent oxidoreductase [Micromonospora sp. KC207]TDC63758.1 SDR family NAD(P)-dependent oxidoreductase [Micromonospora sp. KC207]